MARKTGIPGMEWKELFKEAAKLCKEKVASFPKGDRLAAFRSCMKETLREFSERKKALA